MSTRQNLLPILRHLLLCELVGVLYLLSAHYCTDNLLYKGEVELIWLPAGIAVAAALRFGPSMILVAGIAEFVGICQLGLPAWSAYLPALSRALATGTAWVLMRDAQRSEFPFGTIRQSIRFVLAGVVLAPVVNALGSPLMHALYGRSHFNMIADLALQNWLGDSGAILILVPFLLSFRRQHFDVFKGAARVAELVLVIGLLVALSLWAFSFEDDEAPFILPALMFIPVPLVVWAAFRFQAIGMSAATTTLAFVLLWHTSTGREPLAHEEPTHTMIVLWSFLAFTSISHLLTINVLSDRFRQESKMNDLMQMMQIGLVVQDEAARVTTFNPAALQILGITADQLRGATSFDPRWHSIHEDGSPFPGEEHPAVHTLRSGESLRDVVMGVRRGDGTLVWILINSTARHDSSGRVTEVIVTFADITRTKSAELSLRQRDGMLRALSHSAAEFLAASQWEGATTTMLERLGCAALVDRSCYFEEFTDEGGSICYRKRCEWSAPGISPLLNHPLAASVNMNRSGLGRWLTMFSEGQAICAHVRDLPPAERPVLEAMEIKSVMCVPVISQHKRRGLLGFDMCRRERLWTDQERDVLRAAASMVAEAIRRSEAEASQMLVTRELDHRVKNNLASVLAIAEQTARRTEDISSFLSAFSGRVQALAIAHEVITRQRLLGGSFRALLDEMAQPFRRGTPDRIVISGSDILLPCDLVPAMAMIVNELFTNAIKHGSLRTETGRIRIGWDADKRPDGTGLLHVLWDEQGSDPAPNLGPRGFGTSLIETMAAHQLRGSAAIEMKPMGIQCRLEVPLPSASAILDTPAASTTMPGPS